MPFQDSPLLPIQFTTIVEQKPRWWWYWDSRLGHTNMVLNWWVLSGWKEHCQIRGSWFIELVLGSVKITLYGQIRGVIWRSWLQNWLKNERKQWKGIWDRFQDQSLGKNWKSSFGRTWTCWIFFLIFDGHINPFLEPLILLFWTSGVVSSGFQSQNGQPYSHLAQAYVYFCVERCWIE